MIEGITNQQIAFGACLFGATATVGYLIASRVTRADRDPLHERLRATTPTYARGPISEDRGIRPSPVSPIVERVSKAVAEPLMPKDRDEVSRLRRGFAHAGIYSTPAIHLFVMCKVVLCSIGVVSGLLVGLMFREPLLAAVLAAVEGLVGLMIPTLWLKWQIGRRQWSLETSLPDALDLMVVCVEAGLTIDAALQRVGHEIELAHPDISRELGIAHMETRVGVPRIEALRNLGVRTGCASLQSLAAMLVQAERFGTSVGSALRVHAESLRIKRQHTAEERAAKTTVKLAFPVVLFIFPTVVLVLGGPAFILFFQSPLFHR
jgi:tight adherence protein C